MAGETDKSLPQVEQESLSAMEKIVIIVQLGEGFSGRSFLLPLHLIVSSDLINSTVDICQASYDVIYFTDDTFILGYE